MGKDLLKQEGQDRGLALALTFIPASGIKLPSCGPQSKTECTGQYLPLEKAEFPVNQNFNQREDELEADWEFYPLIQKLDDGDYPSDDSLFKELSARLRNLNGHNNRKGLKNFYLSQDPWPLESTWHLEEHQCWPESTMDIVESAPRGTQ